MLREMLAAAILALPGREERKRKALERENRRLHDRVDALTDAVTELRCVAIDWLNTMEADGYGCTCDTDTPCPLCRCESALWRR